MEREAAAEEEEATEGVPSPFHPLSVDDLGFLHRE